MAPHQLGTTGLTVSRIGLGLAALGRPAYINLHRSVDLGTARDVESFERRCHQMLDAAYATGVRYVDAARSYGFAEAFLGSWLATARDRREPVTIGSKWGYSYVGAWRMDAPQHEVKDLTVHTLRHQIAESRALLGDRLGLYQIHSATLESGVLDNLAVLTALADLRAQGTAIGLSVSGAEQPAVIRRALDVTVDGRSLFQTVQATWNPLEPSAGVALAEAHAAGWGVIVKEALANGRLTNRNDDPGLARLKRRAAELETTVDALAIAAALANPWVDVVLSGAVTTEQLHSNISALTLDASAADWTGIEESPDEYWTERRTLGWN